MPIKLTVEQADQYAFRMYDDEYWNKKYIPKLDAVRLVKEEDSGLHIELPVTLQVERTLTGESDFEEYKDRCKTIEELDEYFADDDQGLITVECTLAIPYPLNAYGADEKDVISLVRAIGIKLKSHGIATMYEGEIRLASNATEHLLNRINPIYVCIDTLDQNKLILDEITSIAKDLKI